MTISAHFSRLLEDLRCCKGQGGNIQFFSLIFLACHLAHIIFPLLPSTASLISVVLYISCFFLSKSFSYLPITSIHCWNGDSCLLLDISLPHVLEVFKHPLSCFPPCRPHVGEFVLITTEKMSWAIKRYQPPKSLHCIFLETLGSSLECYHNLPLPDAYQILAVMKPWVHFRNLAYHAC